MSHAARRRRQNFAFPPGQPARAARASGLPALAALSSTNGCSSNGRKAKARPTKYCSTLPADTDLPRRSLQPPKSRWRIERDYQELKAQELGLDHYEGRGWRGFHHHMALCVAAYGIPGLRTGVRFPPSGDKTRLFQAPRLSPGYRPRGAPDPTRTPHQSVNRNHPH